MSKNCRTLKGPDTTGYNAPVMAFDSRRICLMECFAGKSGLFDSANIVKFDESAK